MMSAEEILAALDELMAAAKANPDGEMTDEQASRYEELEAQYRKVQRQDGIEKRHAAYKTPLPGLQENANEGNDSEYTRAFGRFLRGAGDQVMESPELRTLSKGTDSAGGYLVPDEWRDKLVECIKSFGNFAAAAEEVNSNDGRKWLWPTLSDETTGTPNEAAIVAESAAFAGGADPVFGEASLDVYKYTTTGAGNNPVRVTVELLQDSGTDIDALLRRLFARRIARKQERDFIVGTGSGQPKGILNGTADFELSTTNVWDQTNNGYGDLVAIETLLDEDYLQNASWLMNKTTYSQILGMTDDNGRPLIENSTAGIAEGVGRRKTLLGYPVIINSYAPNAADDTNFMAFGDFRQAYVVRRVRQVEVIADPYARKSNGEVEYVAWQRAGGTVQDRCAYVIIKGKDA